MKQVDVAALHAALEAGKVPVLVDVRSAFEYAGGHVPGAVHLPLDRVAGSGEVWLICQSGARSAAAARQLKAKGVDVVDVVGGTSAWRARGYPIERTRSLSMLLLPLGASLTLGLAPFFPEPHLLGKLQWLAGGAVGMGAIDWFDLVFHGAPWAWLAWSVVGYARADPPGPSAGGS